MEMDMDICENKQLPLLNDDCLLKIFSYLELKDLCVIAGLSKRFKDVARRVFGLKWKELSLTVENMRDTAVAIDYIRKFGPKIQTLRLLTTQELQKAAYNILFNIAVKYCGEGDSLTCLEMHGFAFNLEAIEDAHVLFARVKHLILNGCEISVKWIIKCPELVELDLMETHVTYNGVRDQTCLKLEALKIKGSKPWVQKSLHLFLQQNPQLRTFKAIPESGKSVAHARVLDFVPSGIENMEIAPLETSRLTRFTSLKELSIRAEYLTFHKVNVIVQLLRSTCATLEYLQIDAGNCCMNLELADAISKFKRLHTLKIHLNDSYRAHFYPDGVHEHIVRSLENLKVFALQTDYANHIDANKLLEIIQHAPNLQQLVLAFRQVFHLSNIVRLDAETYSKMLNVILRRSSRKPLHVIFVSHRRFLEESVQHNFPMEPMLKISAVPLETIVPNDVLVHLYELWPQIDVIEKALKMV